MSRPRTPGIVMAITAIVLLVLIAGLALTQRQPPPPSIAEFAPQAVDNITEAPDDQGGSQGGGSGSAAAGASTPEPTPTPITVPSARRCIGDPPRQIEDPQSPPCVPYWEGDNGGNTWKGVTRDEIRVAVPHNAANFKNKPGEMWLKLATFFNRRFQFYGRQIHLVPVLAGGDDGRNKAGGHAQAGQDTNGAAKQQANAVEADEGQNAFASLPYPDVGGSRVYYDELARRKIVTVEGLVPREQEPYFAKFHPYSWSYAPTLDRTSRNFGRWTCQTLASGAVKHAGPTELGKPRKFGILYTRYTDGVVDIEPLQQTIRGCGIQAETAEMSFTDMMSGDQESTRLALTKLRNDGVTSVLCMCHNWMLIIDVFPQATNQQWFPEWMLPSMPFVEQDVQIQKGVPEQTSHLFGISGFNKNLPVSDLPVNWAMQEVQPGFEWDVDQTAHLWSVRRYAQLLVLASGIQLAGPKLNPQNFADGLQKTVFPNPVTEYKAGRVSFAGDHSMVDDYSETWWGVNQQSHWGGVGAWCYVDHGTRHTESTWPSGERPVFQGECD